MPCDTDTQPLHLPRTHTRPGTRILSPFRCFLGPGTDRSDVSGHCPPFLASWGNASPEFKPTFCQLRGLK